MNQEKWDDRFQQLLAYKDTSDYCKIPSRDGELQNSSQMALHAKKRFNKN
jgi:hypothetical protein